MAETIRRRYLRKFLELMLAGVGQGVLGCSADDALPRQSIAGQIRVDDKPLPRGMVHFYGRGNDGSRLDVSGGAMIRDGRFSIPRKFGLVPGKYTVAVFSGGTTERKRRKERGPEDEDTVPQEMIPAKFNSQSSLEIEITDAHAIKDMTIDVESN